MAPKSAKTAAKPAASSKADGTGLVTRAVMGVLIAVVAAALYQVLHVFVTDAPGLPPAPVLPPKPAAPACTSDTAAPNAEPSAKAKAKAKAEAKSKTSVCSSSDFGDNYELQFVQAIARHGARTPLRRIPTDNGTAYERRWTGRCDMSASVPAPPHTTTPAGADPTHCAPGQLTALGVSQHRALGQRLRARYVTGPNTPHAHAHGGFLPANWSDAQGLVSLRSSNMSRTIISCANTLAELYPDLPTAELLRQHLHVRSAAHETLFAVYDACPAARFHFNTAKRAEAFREFLASETATFLREAVDELYALSAANFSVPSFVALSDILTAEQAHGINSANGFSAEGLTETADVRDGLLAAVERVGALSFAHTLTATKDLTRYSIGAFVSELFSGVQNRRTGLSALKMALYLAHDTTLLPLIAVLDVPRPDAWIEFAALLELQYFAEKPKPKADAGADADADAAAGAKASAPKWLIRVVLNGAEQKCSPLVPVLQRMQQYTLPAYHAAREERCVKDVPPDADPTLLLPASWEEGC